MDMTPEKLAFIKGQSQAAANPQAATPVAKVQEKTIEVAVTKKDTESEREPAARSTRRTAKRPTQETPGASEVLDRVLVPVTIRLLHRTAQALRRAYLEQRLKHAKPDTQQEIVEEALGDWLLRQGFLE